MPGALHRGIVELLRRDLSLIVELALAELGRGMPGGRLRFEERDGRLVATSFESQPREIAVDLLILASEDQRKRLVATVEAQLRIDPVKRFRMLEYVAAARRDHRCVGLQIMFSPDPEVIEKTRRSFKEEPHFCPILLGPANIPKLVDVEAARARPVLATLSAIVHAHAPEGPAIIEALVHSWHERDDRAWHADARILWSCISEDIMNTLNIPMALDRFQSDEVLDDDDDDTTEPSTWERGTGLWQRALREGLSMGRAEGREQGREEGREQGRAEGREQGREEGREEGREQGLRRALVLVTTSLGRELDAAELHAIDSADRAQLEAWLRDGFAPRQRD
jgi:hypothetical protein